MIFLNETQTLGDLCEKYGSRVFLLAKLGSSGVAVLPSFAISLKDRWSDSELIAAVDRIGGFPVSISLGGADSTSSFVNFQSGEREKDDDDINSIESLKKSIELYSNFYNKESTSNRSNGIKNVSVIIQQVIRAKYRGNGYSIDPYSANENLFLVELGHTHYHDKSKGEILLHSYSVNYHDCSISQSEVGTGYVNFTKEMLEIFSNILLEVQNILKIPQKVKFYIDENDKIWIGNSKTVAPILFNRDSGQYFGLDILDPNVGFEVYSPMMFSLMKQSADLTIQKEFPDFKLDGDCIIQRFGRPFLRFESIIGLLHRLPSSSFSFLHQALDIPKRVIPEDVTRECPFPILSALKAKFNLNRRFRTVLRQFEDLEGQFEVIDLKYRAYRQNVESQPHRKLEVSFNYLLKDYYFPVASLYYSMCMMEVCVRAELMECLDQIGVTHLFDKDFLGGIGESPNVALQNDLAILFEAFRDHRPSSDIYQDELKSFLNRHYYYGDASRDIMFARWGDDTVGLEVFFDALVKNNGIIRTISENGGDEDKHLPLELFDIFEGIKKLPFHKRYLYRARLEKTIATFRQVYQARRSLYDYTLRSLFIARSYLTQLADNFTELGILKSPKDIFFLHIDELNQVIEDKDKFKKLGQFTEIRKKQHNGICNFVPPRQYGAMVTPTDNTDIFASGVLKGYVGSPGIAEGEVVIIRTPADYMRVTNDSIVIAGDIESGPALIAGVAKALVFEYGNTMTQVASLCRKNKIPMLLRVKEITKLLKDGDRVIVDCDKGQVSLVS